MNTEEYLDSLLRSVTGEAPPEKKIIKDEDDIDHVTPSVSLSEFVNGLYPGENEPVQEPVYSGEAEQEPLYSGEPESVYSFDSGMESAYTDETETEPEYEGEQEAYYENGYEAEAQSVSSEQIFSEEEETVSETVDPSGYDLDAEPVLETDSETDAFIPEEGAEPSENVEYPSEDYEYGDTSIAEEESLEGETYTEDPSGYGYDGGVDNTGDSYETEDIAESAYEGETDEEKIYDPDNADPDLDPLKMQEYGFDPDDMPEDTGDMITETETAEDLSFEAEAQDDPGAEPGSEDQPGTEPEAMDYEEPESEPENNPEEDTGAGDADEPEMPDAMMSQDDLDALLSSLDDMGDPTTSHEEVLGGSDPAESLSDVEEEGRASADENGMDRAEPGEGSAADESDGSNDDPGASSEEPASVLDESLSQEDIEALLERAANGEEDEEEASSKGAEELKDLLAAGEGDMDISEISDLLEKDEKNEAVDPSVAAIMDDNEDAAGALFGEDSESPPANDRKAKREQKKKERQRKKEERKRKKEEKRLAKLAKKQKNKGEVPEADDSGNLDAEMQEALDSGLIDKEQFEDLKQEKEKEDKAKEKKGFFAKIVDALMEEEEDDRKFAEETAVDIAKAGASDNEKILAELEDQSAPEETAKKKEKKAKPQKAKKKKAKPKKAAKPKKPPKPKKPKKPSYINTGPDLNVPKKKVILVMFMCMSLGVLAGIMAVVIPFYSDMKNARIGFEDDNYKQVFMDLTAHRLTEEEQELYDKNLILYKVSRRYDSYSNYMALGMRTEALNSLVQGIKVIGQEERKAVEYGVSERFDFLANKIIDSLQNTFGVTIDQAQSWLAIKNSEEYTRTLQDYAEGRMTGPDAVSEPSSESPAENPSEPSYNSLIEAEESEFGGNL
ncbi:MAG: hypothetical protein K5770_05140 [Lachnospiraceae bacterium]|nr:hypothetical protein [Lachnospiraceae bacterium]